MSDSWRKSSYSGANGGSCVETASGVGVIFVRDTTNRDGGGRGGGVADVGACLGGPSDPVAAVIGIAALAVSVGAFGQAARAQRQADTDATDVAGRLAVVVEQKEAEARRQRWDRMTGRSTSSSRSRRPRAPGRQRRQRRDAAAT